MEMQRGTSLESEAPPRAPKKLLDRARSPRKWHLFSRSQTRSNANIKSKKNEVQAAVVAVQKRQVPFYAMLDSSENGESTALDIQEFLRCAKVYAPSPAAASMPETHLPEFGSPEHETTSISSKSHVHPTLGHGRREAGQPPWTCDPMDQEMASGPGKRSRLLQVGRIPIVVRGRSQNASPQSFSRPFLTSFSNQPQAMAAEVYDPESIAKGPTPVSDAAPEARTGSESIGVSSDVYLAPKECSEPTWDDEEFISFSPPTMSDVTSSSSSGGVGPFVGATAVIPKPDDPPAEDEVWDEYDDLLGVDNDRPRRSATSSQGIPFYLELYQRNVENDASLESPVLVPVSGKVTTHSKAPPHLTSPNAGRTERIWMAVQSHLCPVIPPSATEGSNSCGTGPGRVHMDVSLPQEAKRGSMSSGKTVFSDSSAVSSEDGSPLAQVNLRVGSMTVSKWLTFGQVLFSDVRHELVVDRSAPKRHSVLVIDGLGNDDWSFYAAETYPSASFYNLSPRAPLPTQVQNSPSSFPLAPANHHQVQYMCQLEKFPFAPQSFDCLVYRFPVAGPELQYKNIVNEARRVLRPGGYLELSILDVDLNNMGNRGRRAIRRLKEHINEQTAGTNLASTADLVLRLLGNAGFSDIKSARVGVPVASSIRRSDAGVAKRTGKDEGIKKKDAPSLAEMMSDDSPTADANITKIVSRIGRWWYTRCYEGTSGCAPDKSIWADKPLLSECERLGTSLKLMVCCARAPDRVSSV
ncbi:hypothetical protein RJ55_04558 [Drechmeria coniospora]|nr:hypothetical protein RJ55_04558 [Drechmeria coniospora]